MTRPIRLNRTSTIFLGAFCILVLGIILVAGLWPFNPFPSNQVTWLANRQGLHFDGRAILWTKTPLGTSEQAKDSPCSLEIWMEPAETIWSGTLLGFYDPVNHDQLRLAQFRDGLLLRKSGRAELEQRTPALFVPHALESSKKALLSIIGEPASVSIFLDGKLVEARSGYVMHRGQVSGQLILGTSPVNDSVWSGNIYGLALYGRALTAAEVALHFQTWVRNGRPAIEQSEEPVALFLFNEGMGDRVANQVSGGAPLEIPTHFTLPHQIFLERPWDEFRPTPGYLRDLAINVAGFIPLGFFFCLYAKRNPAETSAELKVILVGAGISLLIEVLQAFLPTRSSGMTDLITNTSGTALGVYASGNRWIQTVLEHLVSAVERRSLG